MKKENKDIVLAIGVIIIFIIYTMLIKTIDIKAIGPHYSKVGFATINQAFHNVTGMNEAWYKISKYLGILPLCIIGIYALIGCIQLIKRKKILKVDKPILTLGVFYIIVGIIYLFFEKVIVNYRPVLTNGKLEASFPSSHTVLAICVCASSVLISKYYIKNKKTLKIANIISYLLMILIVVSRLLSGVHWLTDIIGGILISISLVLFLKGNLPEMKKKGK